MPKLNDLQNFNYGSFSFSGTRPEDLGEVKYTIVNVVTDSTGSVFDFADELLRLEKEVLSDARRAPYKHQIIFRITRFNTSGVHEVRGFQPVLDMDTNLDSFSPTGGTNLIDAIVEAIKAVMEYGKTLHADDFDVNGLVIVSSDGDENGSTMSTMAELKRLITEYQKSETLDSLKTILIGINTSGTTFGGKSIADVLSEFQQKSGIEQFVDAGDVKPGLIGKIATFISQSTSSASQALGSGSPSQNLEF